MPGASGKAGLSISKLREQIRELRRTNRELNDRVVELDCLYQILRSLTATMSLAQTADALRNFFTSRFQVERFALYLRDEDSGTFVLRNSYRLPRETEGHIRLPLQPWLQSVCSKGYCFRSDALSEDEPLAQLIGPGVSAFVLSLKGLDGRDVGLVALGRGAAERFSRRDAELLRKLGKQIGPMIGAMMHFEKTKELSFTDPLTGVHNRRYFNQVYVREFERARRYSRPLSVLMIDIDHFKIYNDTLGHLAGDALLRRLAQELADNLRRTDYLARYGGEEFAVLLPETDYERACRVAEKLRRQVELTRFDGEEVQPEGKLTISVGAASYPRHADDPLQLLEMADRSLYGAKANGRNQVGPAPEELYGVVLNSRASGSRPQP
jgi:diguanylate cyclase (GGDEF)-like protein